MHACMLACLLAWHVHARHACIRSCTHAPPTSMTLARRSPRKLISHRPTTRSTASASPGRPILGRSTPVADFASPFAPGFAAARPDLRRPLALPLPLGVVVPLEVVLPLGPVSAAAAAPAAPAPPAASMRDGWKRPSPACACMCVCMHACMYVCVHR